MDQNLKKLKMDLDAAIRRTKGLDELSRQKLDRLVRYVDMKLQKPDDPANNAHLTGYLEDNIQYFEATHPDLTMVMNNMLTMLGNLGI
ncbi:MAG: DUF4404 family protein [Desulfobacterales bacterium]|jgi:hypothetical protein